MTSLHVALYGTSANPPHRGHTNLVAYFASLPYFDEPWVLPVYKHIYDSKQNLARFEDRLAMAEAAFGPVAAKVKVTQIEKDVVLKHIAAAKAQGQSDEEAAKVRVGSIDTLRHVQAAHPGAAFSWILGADTYADLAAGKWKCSDEFQRSVSICVVQRPGQKPVQMPPHKSDSKVTVTLHDLPSSMDISSTEVRATTDLTKLASMLDPAVLKYVQDHQLYSFAPQK